MSDTPEDRCKFHDCATAAMDGYVLCAVHSAAWRKSHGVYGSQFKDFIAGRPVVPVVSEVESLRTALQAATERAERAERDRDEWHVKAKDRAKHALSLALELKTAEALLEDAVAVLTKARELADDRVAISKDHLNVMAEVRARVDDVVRRAALSPGGGK